MSSDDERTPLLQPTPTTKNKGKGKQVRWREEAEEASTIVKLGRAVGALRAGRYPSQGQLNASVERLLRSSLLQLEPAKKRIGRAAEGPLSAEGRRLVESVRRLLRAGQRLGAAKNSQDEIQQFLFHSKQASFDFNVTMQGSSRDMASTLPAQRDLQRDTQAFLYSGQILLRLVLSNILNSSTSILADVLSLFRNILADTADQIGQQATATADAIRPNEDLENLQPEEGVDTQITGLKETLADTQEAAGDATQILKDIPHKISETSQDDIKQTVAARFHKLIGRIRQDPDATQAVEVMLSLTLKYIKTAEEIGTTASAAVNDTKIDVETHDVDNHATLAMAALKSLFDKISGQSSTQIQDTIDKVAYDICSNDPLFDLATDLDQYVRRSLTDLDYFQSSESSDKAADLWQQYQNLSLVNPDWKRDSRSLLQQISAAFLNLQNDPEIIEMGAAVQDILGHFALLSKKSLRVMLGDTRGIIWDIVNVFLPRLFQILKQFPVPRVEMVTPDIDFVCDDFVLEELSLLPSFVKVDTNSQISITRETDVEAQMESAAKVDGSSTLYLRGIRFACRDISFWLKRKNSWIPFLREEQGFVDFSLLQKGLEATVAFRLNDPVKFGIDELPHIAESEQDSFFTIENVDVKLSDIDLQVRRSYHPILYWILRPFMKFGMRIGLRYILSSAIKTQLEDLDKIAFKLKSVVDAKRARGSGPVEAWLSALASPAPSAISSSVQGAYTQGQSLLEGASLTTKGIVKVDKENDLVLGIGASQLLPGKGGPDHFGPHANYGSGSIGRIQADVDTVATEGATQVKNQAQAAAKGVSNIAQDIKTLQEDKSMLEQTIKTEERLNSSTKDTWRSVAFDI